MALIVLALMLMVNFAQAESSFAAPCRMRGSAESQCPDGFTCAKRKDD
ncbi:MAG: hypothetical protein J6K72_06310 [Clostridia bacterium]|nr:hypothetical protein [Clostridia bacterium]